MKTDQVQTNPRLEYLIFTSKQSVKRFKLQKKLPRKRKTLDCSPLTLTLQLQTNIYIYI